MDHYVDKIHGLGWDPVTVSDVESLWGVADNAHQITQILQGFGHGYSTDSPIGWLDIEGEGNTSTLGSNRLMLHNNKQKYGLTSSPLNNYDVHSSATDTSKTIIRNVSGTEQALTCPSCPYDKVKAPILIKTEISDEDSHPTNVYQSWGTDISYYSIGDELTGTEVGILDSAYRDFCKLVGRTTRDS